MQIPLSAEGRIKRMEDYRNNQEDQNNQVMLTGKMLTDFRYVYKDVHENAFYRAELDVGRLSGISDLVPVVVSEGQANREQYHKGSTVRVKGQYHSRNRKEGGKSRLKLSVFAREIEAWDGAEEDYGKNNSVFLDGYICKEPVYRKTPLGRTITDLLVAVNRQNGISDYIPCICWGGTARDAASLEVGAHVQMTGRIQSREYLKRTGESGIQKRIAYEVSVKKLDVHGESDIQR